MSAVSASARREATIHVRVTEPAQAPELVSYLDGLGLRALAGPDGRVTIRVREDVIEWFEARRDIERSIDSCVRSHGVPVQLT